MNNGRHCIWPLGSSPNFFPSSPDAKPCQGLVLSSFIASPKQLEITCDAHKWFQMLSSRQVCWVLLADIREGKECPVCWNQGRCKDTCEHSRAQCWTMALRSLWVIAPVVRAACIFTLPSWPWHSQHWNFFRWLPCLVFNQYTQRKEIFFLSAFAEWNLLVLLTGHALDTVGLVRTLNSEHIGLLALLNLFPYAEYKLHPSPYPPKPFNLWVILQPIPS